MYLPVDDHGYGAWSLMFGEIYWVLHIDCLLRSFSWQWPVWGFQMSHPKGDLLSQQSGFIGIKTESLG